MNFIVIDNFLPYPNVVRSWALSQDWMDCERMTQETGHKNTWPGFRTKQVSELDNEYANVVLSRISTIANYNFGISGNIEIASSFQLTTKKDGDSWIHLDNDVQVAGLLYLSPNAPLGAGTTFYNKPPHEIVDTIGNVFNRLILYKADMYHKSTEYFGEDMQDGRLTQVFFIKSI
jgi:hypothetical protein